MKTVALRVKPNHGASMLLTERFLLSRSVGGIAGSAHADPMSPRQLLVGDSEFRDGLVGDVARLRWNLDVKGLLPNARPGRVLEFPSGARIWLSMLCEPCSQLNGIQDWSRLGSGRGFLAMVLVDGVVGQGDAVAVLDDEVRPLPDRPVERVCDVLTEIIDERSAISIPTLSSNPTTHLSIRFEMNRSNFCSRKVCGSSLLTCSVMTMGRP
jgi:hypothetical protein